MNTNHEPDLANFLARYETKTHKMSINGKELTFFVPRDITDLIDMENPMRNFPLWAKVWEAAIVLLDHMARLKPSPERRVLEIGAGLGTVGITAASLGHRVTITEYNPDALEFIRANCLANGCKDVEVLYLDWNNPILDGKFDLIIGSEVVYREQDIDNLKKLFDQALAPNGQVVLAEQLRSTGMSFWQKMALSYSIKARRVKLRSDDTPVQISIFELKPLGNKS